MNSSEALQICNHQEIQDLTITSHRTSCQTPMHRRTSILAGIAPTPTNQFSDKEK
uniref:Uncharacterized protein n=1 Tax=Solanum lycopersicum TaxID=4081 RepID=A0A3Q7J9D2_SOLLC